MASNYPGAIDNAASLFSPVDAFSGKPLETTTTGAVQAGDSTINVASTSGGFAASYGIVSIGDELIVYSGKAATSFTGCQRGAFGTTASGHNNGVAVKANMVAGFITALQSAVLAIENELGTAAARNYIRKDGAVTVTGLKTFQDGAEFGAGAKSSTGLVRLPNGGAVKWRKADNSGDLGIALNANNHLAMDAVIDFAAGQTFGATTVPDATTLSKGIVQIDPVGGIAVNNGVISLSASGVGPATYTKVTVDSWGRATAGAQLAAGDLPAHTHVAADIVSGALPFTIQNNGAAVGTRRALNLIQGANIGLTFLDVPASDRVNVTIAFASVPGHTHAEADVTGLATDLAGKAPLSHTHAQADVTGLVTALAGKAPTFHTHAEADITGLVADLAGKATSVHTHTSSQISDATANATAGTVVLRDVSGGASFAYAAANNMWAYLDSHLNSIECGPFQSAGGPYENMAKYSEDLSVGTWDKNGGTCTVSTNSVVAPDGNQTADAVTASGAAGLIRQNIAGLVANGQYTFYVWLKVPSGTMTVSLGILDNGWTTWLVGPTPVTLTTSWQRFKVTGTMTGGATSLWIAGHYTDGWTSGQTFHAWGACLQQGNDPKKAYARTWGYQAGPVSAGVACGPLLVAAKDNVETPFRVAGPGSNLADHTLLQVTPAGELLIAGGSGNG
ncbi:MAG: hypothetical protein IT165_15510 [Bryobacterales bacterium]|nr:hypothetical protein [Bryobacterales bacterium]